MPRVSRIIKIDLKNGNLPSVFTGGIRSVNRTDGDRLTATFYSASTCAAELSGEIYVTDAQKLVQISTEPSYIRRVYKDGTTTTAYRGPLKAVSVGFSIDRKLLFASYETSAILSIDGKTGSGTSTETTEINQVQNPSGVISDSAGNLFVTETSDNCIRWIDSKNKKEVNFVAGGCGGSMFGYVDSNNPVDVRFNRPRMMVFDSKGKL